MKRDQLQAYNFESLEKTFFFESDAVVAVRFFEAWSSDRLATLLRHHSAKSVVGVEEIFLRDCFDSLLSYYGLLELSCQLDYIRHPITATKASSALAILDCEPVRRYYEEHYPLVLPYAFRCRLSGALALRDQPVGDSAIPLFQDFLSLDLAVKKDPDLGIFLRLLDGFYFDNVSLRDVVAAVKDPDIYMMRAATHPQDRDLIDRALVGFRRLLRVLSKLDSILTQCADLGLPLVCSGMWHHYSYWLSGGDLLGEDGFLGLVRSVREWPRYAGESGAVSEGDAQMFADDAVALVEGLMSHNRGHRLRLEVVACSR